MTILLNFFQVLLSLGLAVFALSFRTPFLASVRDVGFWVICGVSLGLMALAWRGYGLRKSRWERYVKLGVMGIASFSVVSAIALTLNFQIAKMQVLQANPTQLAYLGQHFMVGYTDLKELQTLVEKQAIGGVYITRRNIIDKSKAEIQSKIQALQTIRQRQGLSPLWIATDQEGGIVSRFSPPLTRLPALSQIIESSDNFESRKQAIIDYAQKQGEELVELGINLNFAPVVDINKSIINPQDKYSQIYRRAISSNPNIVAEVGLTYCQILEKTGVECTLKHFPGLGRVENDTHLTQAELFTPIAELASDDWIPFRQILQQTTAWTMLGHTQLMAVDSKHPVSFSQAVITGILRQDWQHNGILITDDFSMGAVYRSADGFKKATIKALNAGVDVILIAYDPDLYYPAMQTLLKAQTSGRLSQTMLNQSQERLQRK